MEIKYELKKLKKQENVSVFFDAMETVVVIISGKYRLCFNNSKESIYGDRESVYNSCAHVIYVPVGCRAVIYAESEELVVVIASTFSDKKKKSFVKKGGFKQEIRGEKEYKRTVIDLINENDDTDSLFVGETYHSHGVWSGYPPHKHDNAVTGKESVNEEVYFVKIQPANSFGVFIKYKDKSDKEAFVVNDEDFVYVKDGYHAILSAPGCEFYYLWIASSKGKEFICAQDQDFLEEENASNGEKKNE